MRTVIIILAILRFSLSSYGQVDSTSIFYPNLDTLVTYDVSLQAESGPGYARYFVNGEQVGKNVYDSYRKFWDNIGKCRPCLLRTYNTDDILIREPVQYTDCGVGKFLEFNLNGTLKVAGSYMINRSGDWQNIFQRGFCQKDGKWMYYDSLGRLTKVEHYVDGILIMSSNENGM